MYFRCYNSDCPEFFERPCELSYMEMQNLIGCSTPCPIGEGDGFFECEEGSEFFCLIIGSRNFTDYDRFKQVTDQLLAIQVKNQMQLNIVSGEGNGADTLAERYAKENGYRFIKFAADWNSYGKQAGPIHNERMHKFIFTMASEHEAKRGVIAFWDGKSKDTEQSFDLARKYNNPLRVIRVKEER